MLIQSLFAFLLASMQKNLECVSHVVNSLATLASLLHCKSFNFQNYSSNMFPFPYCNLKARRHFFSCFMNLIIDEEIRCIFVKNVLNAILVAIKSLMHRMLSSSSLLYHCRQNCRVQMIKIVSTKVSVFIYTSTPIFQLSSYLLY